MDKDKKLKKGRQQAKRNQKAENSGSEEIEDFDEPAFPKPGNRNKISAFALLADEDNESISKSDDSSSEKEEPTKTNGKKAVVSAAANQNQKKNKKAAKGGKKGDAENEDFDAILEEFSGKPALPVEEKKSKKKKKGSTDVDKIFDGLEIPVTSEQLAPAPKQQLPSQPEIRSDMTADELAKIVEMMAMEDEEDEDDKKKKKKNKKQQKQLPKEAKEGSDDESANDEDDEEGGSTVKSAAQKKKEKKERQKQEKLKKTEQTKLKEKEKKDTTAPVSAQEKEAPTRKAEPQAAPKPVAGPAAAAMTKPAAAPKPVAEPAAAAKPVAEPAAAPKPVAEPSAVVAKPEATVAEIPAAAPAEEATSGKSKKEKDKKKKKGEAAKEEEKSKKPSKLVNKILETQRLLKEEEERLKREEEERIRKEEEEIRLQEEKERLEKERKERKKQKEKEKEKRLKAEGKWLSKEDKEDKKKIKQLIEFRKAQGLPVPGAKTAGDSTTELTAAVVDKPKRVVYASKPKRKPQQPAVMVTPTEQKDIATEVVEIPDVVEQPPAEVKVEEEPEDVKDNWDDESESDDETSPVLEKPKAVASTKSIKPVAAPTKEVAATAKAVTATTKAVAASKAAAVPHKAHTVTQSAVKSQTSKEESSDDSDDESSCSESSIEEEEVDTRTQREKALDRIKKRREAAESARSLDNLRAPVVCVLGHVDTGKTKILDKLRRSHVQDGEAGGITQQIGATNVPQEALKEQTKMCKDFEIRLPGLLIIDTPGHESFSNLRTRGSSLCDIAILVVDIMHGLEPQTIESINILKQRKTPFVVALNKIDRLNGWVTNPRSDIANLIKKQKINTIYDFDDRVKLVTGQFAEQSLNACLSYENKNPREYISLVPTSATTGDGIGNLMALICKLTQNMLAKRLMYSEELQATVMEVKAIPGHGTTIDVILVNGRLTIGSTIVVAGQDGPIVTQVRSLLMPQPMHELRVKSQFEQHKEVVAAQGCKIAAKDLEKALAGLPLHVAHDDEEVEIFKEEIAQMVKDVLGSFKVSEKGVYVQASTLGSLEALLKFLSDSEIPYSGINIGPVHKRDIMRTSVMLEHDPLYACVLAFDVKIEKEAQELADKDGIRIFSADIIYHLFDEFMAFREKYFKQKQEEFKNIAVYPCKLRVLPDCVFKTRDPIVCGVVIEAGSLRVGTVLCIPSKNLIDIGRVSSIEINNKPVDKGAIGQEVCIKIDAIPGEAPKLYGRHFDHTDLLVSKISRQSIDAVKSWFRDDMSRADWQLIKELKAIFEII